MKGLPDYESVKIDIELKEIKKDPTTSKLDQMPAIGLKVNLYSSVVINRQGEFKVVAKNASNSRDQRLRPDTEHKSAPILIPGERGKNEMAKETGEYGNKWAELKKGSPSCTPNLNEMIEGLIKWYIQ